MRYRLDRFYEDLQIAAGRRKMSVTRLQKEIGAYNKRRDKWKQGEPTVLELVCICEVLGCNIDDLLK